MSGLTGIHVTRVLLTCTLLASTSLPDMSVSSLRAPESRRREADAYAGELRRCTGIAQVKRLHWMVKEDGLEGDTFVANMLIQMYGRWRSLGDAVEVFEKMEVRNQFSWNIMLGAYAQNGHLAEARRLFDSMPTRNEVSWNSMIISYARNGCVSRARVMFEKMPHKDIVSWNSMITAYTQMGDYVEALKLFQEMDMEPDDVTFLNVLESCGEIGATVKECRLLHWRVSSCGFEKELKMSTALVFMYGKCGLPDEARQVFDRTSFSDIALWNSMIAAHGRNHELKQAMELFASLDAQGLEPDELTLVSVLDAVACTPDVKRGRLIHASAVDCCLDTQTMVRNAIIYMYGKCGSLADARSVFENTCNKDTISWNSMIGAYANANEGKCVDEAIEMFQLMNLEGFTPNSITFLSMLVVCSHAGLVETGVDCFNVMIEANVTPQTEHYSCMIDLFGRAGWLNEARDLFSNSPVNPSISALRAYLYHGSGTGAAPDVANLKKSHILQISNLKTIP